MNGAATGTDISSASTEAEDEEYRLLLGEAADFIAVTDGDGVYRYASPACRRLFGWEPADLVGRQAAELVHPDDAAHLLAARAALCETDHVTVLWRMSCADGSYRWTESTSRRTEPDGVPLFVSTVREITGPRLGVDGAAGNNHHDPMTGLPGRATIEHKLRDRLAGLSDGEGRQAALNVEIDRFKVITSSWGQAVGETLVVQLAERLARCLGAGDVLGHLTGSEFVIVPDLVADAAGVAALVERVHDSCRGPFRVGGTDLVCTISVGASSTDDRDHGAVELISEANLALERSKGHGGDRCETFDEAMRAEAVGRFNIERKLRNALASDEVVVHYQPIFSLQAGVAIGAEALVRIRDGLDLLLPRAFRDVAEEVGLLPGIDEQVLSDALREASGWELDHSFELLSGPAITVNVNARHLADPSFHRSIVDQLTMYGIGFDRMHLEVTENVLWEASQSATAGLRVLRDLGIKVGLDDFGTGYSSLSYLRQFPLDFIKIDQSFMADIDSDPRGRSIVASIVAIAHALDLLVVAEGVETEGQLRVLEDLQCEFAQGFLFATAVEAGEIPPLLAAGRSALISA